MSGEMVRTPYIGVFRFAQGVCVRSSELQLPKEMSGPFRLSVPISYSSVVTAASQVLRCN